MNFSADFVAVQGVLTNVHKNVGDFLSIRHRGGNEQKITAVVDELRSLFTDKKYFRKNKINPKYETNLREINLFLILNTDFTHKEVLANDNKFAHLIDVVPQLSKCLLANIVWNLDFCRFYSEAIYSLPIPISVELLENCNNCLRKGDPYLVLEQVAMIALAIYVKLYHIRNECVEEDRVNNYVSKLLERFTETLQNYITPETSQMANWPSSEMYQYMGVAIHKILHLLKCCFNIFLNSSVAEIHEMYQVNTSGPAYSPERLDKSGQALKKCNICLMSVCEANLQAVTVDIFCSWAEYRHNNAFVQQTIGTLAYEVRQQLDSFEGCGNLPSMLDAIMIKPKSVEDTIREADETTLLLNVKIPDSNQLLWFKALLKHGIMKSPEVFDTFQTVAHLTSKEDILYLLEYSIPFVKDNEELKNCILSNITKLEQDVLIQTIAEYFQKTAINNLYEIYKFDSQLKKLLNKLSLGPDNLSLKDIAVLVLQNPNKLTSHILQESVKNIEHVSNIVKIIKYLEPICRITNEGNNFLTEMVLKFLKENELTPNAGLCFSSFLNQIVKEGVINGQITEQLLLIVDEFVKKNNLSKSIVILKVIKDLPPVVLKNCDSSSIILRLSDILVKVRWNFVTFEEAKVEIVTEVVALINKYKMKMNTDSLSTAINKLSSNPINAYYLSENTNFLEAVSPGFDKNGDHNEQVCRLLKLLPCCTPEEWVYVSTYLAEETNPLDTLQVYIDMMLILSELSKKNSYHSILSYCFQQFCVLVKNNIFPLVSEDVASVQVLIKHICELVYHLPTELQNMNSSLANLFDAAVLKTMVDDKEFMYTLVSISHLEFCKIICSKMV